MTVFLDSSALVKRYVDESASSDVRGIRAPMVASALAQVEVPSAFWGKTRSAGLSPVHAQVASAAFAHDCGRSRGPYAFVALGVEVLALARRLVARHPLRAADAIQLASAVVTRRTVGDCSFGSFDRRLNGAAVAEGFMLAFPDR